MKNNVVVVFTIGHKFAALDYRISCDHIINNYSTVWVYNNRSDVYCTDDAMMAQLVDVPLQAAVFSSLLVFVMVIRDLFFSDLFIYLFVCSFIHLFVCLFIYLYIYLFVPSFELQDIYCKNILQ